MAGVGQEAALQVKRLIDTGEHCVENSNELAQLNGIWFRRDPVMSVFHLERFRLASDFYHRAHSVPGEPPSRSSAAGHPDQYQNGEKFENVAQDLLSLAGRGGHLQEVRAVLLSHQHQGV